MDAVRQVDKNGIAYTLPQIMAPFKSTSQLAAKREAVRLFDQACKQNPDNCQQQPVDGD